MVSRHLTRRTSPRGGAFHGLFPAPCPVPFRARLRQQIKVAIDLGIWDGSRTSAAHGALYIYTNNLVLIQSTLFPSYRRNESIIALYRYNYKEIGGNCVRGDFCSISDPRPLFSLKCRTLSASTPNHDQTRRWMSARPCSVFIFHPAAGFSAGDSVPFIRTQIPPHPTKTFLCVLQTPINVVVLVSVGNERFIKITYMHITIDKPWSRAPFALCFCLQTAVNCCYRRQLVVIKSN